MASLTACLACLGQGGRGRAPGDAPNQLETFFGGLAIFKNLQNQDTCDFFDGLNLWYPLISRLCPEKRRRKLRDGSLPSDRGRGLYTPGPGTCNPNSFLGCTLLGLDTQQNSRLGIGSFIQGSPPKAHLLAGNLSCIQFGPVQFHEFWNHLGWLRAREFLSDQRPSPRTQGFPPGLAASQPHPFPSPWHPPFPQRSPPDDQQGCDWEGGGLRGLASPTLEANTCLLQQEVRPFTSRRRQVFGLKSL